METNKLLGMGRTAKIYKYDENNIIKLFEKHLGKGAVEYEYEVSKIAYGAGINVPEPVKIVEADGQYGIVYRYIEGATMMKLMRKNIFQSNGYARELASLQVNLHKKSAGNLPDIKKVYERRINSIDSLTQEKKQKILDVLSSLPDGSSICHMDFHPDNIIKSKNGYYIIDWTNAARGCAEADIAITSLALGMGTMPPGTSKIFLMIVEVVRKKFHNAYLEEYIRLSNLKMKDISAWELPSLALRLSHNIPEEKEYLLKRIDSLLSCSK